MRKRILAILAALLLFTAPGFAAAAEEDGLAVSIRSSDLSVTIKGRLAAAANQDVLITVIDPDGKLAYFNQTKSDAQGSFQFVYQSQALEAGSYRNSAIGYSSGPNAPRLETLYTYTESSVVPGGPPVQPPAQPGAATEALLELTSSGGVILKPPAVYDEAGRSSQLSIAATLFRQAVQLAKPDDQGVRHLIVRMQTAPGAQAYRIKLPSEALSAEDRGVSWTLSTPHGNLVVSGDMLHDLKLKAADVVEFSFSLQEWKDRDSVLTEGIGDRPVLELNMSVNGQRVHWRNNRSSARVTIPYTPSSHESLSPEKLVVWYTDETGKAVVVPNGRYDASRSGLTFRTKHFSSFAIAYSAKSFADLTGVPWARKSVEALAGKGIVNGLSASRYGPDLPVKRADFLVLLMKTLELADGEGARSQFSDVPSFAYYASAVQTARELGIAKGDAGNRFKPDAPITRQEMAVLAYRALAAANVILPSERDMLDGYEDAANLTEYAKEGVAALTAQGLIQGDGNRFRPGSLTSRAEAAVFIYRLYQLQE